MSINWKMVQLRHDFSKLRSTLRIAFTLIMARTFGQYEHSVTDYNLSYARYRWRGKVWAFPTGPMEDK